jgi:hypothetical protein
MNVFEEVARDYKTYTDAAIASLRGQIQREQRDSQLFPLVLSVDFEIPANKQLIVDVLTIAENTTLTIKGRLRVLTSLQNLGTIQNEGIMVIY